MAVSGAILFALSRSPVGLILQASGQDAVQAGALGFNVVKHKLAAFIISAFFSGLAGALLVFYLGTASVTTLVDITVGVQIIIAAVIGGRRTILGAVLGAIFLIAMSELLRPLGDLSNFIVFAMALVVVLLFPAGFFGLLTRTKEKRDPGGRRASRRQRPHQALWRPGRRQGHGAHVHAGKILGLIGPNGSGKSTVMKLIMGIERPMPAPSASTAPMSRAGPRTRSRGAASASSSSIRARCTGKRCWKTSSSRSCPTGLLLLFADPQTDAAGARHRDPRRLRRRARPPPRHAAVRRSAQDRNRQGDRARPAGSC